MLQRKLLPASDFLARVLFFAKGRTLLASIRRPRSGARRRWGFFRAPGYPLHATLAAAFVIMVNLFLRPLVRLINRQPIAQTEADLHYKIRVVCRNPDEAHVRALLLQGASTGHLSLRRLESTDLEDTSRVEVAAQVTAHVRSDTILEQIVGRLSLESDRIRGKLECGTAGGMNTFGYAPKTPTGVWVNPGRIALKAPVPSTGSQRASEAEPIELPKITLPLASTVLPGAGSKRKRQIAIPPSH